MNIGRLRALIRETWNDKSPLREIVLWYSNLAAPTSAATLAMLRVAPGMIQVATGRPVSSSGFSPSVWVLCVGWVVGGLIGAACGIFVGRLVNSVALDNPTVALVLLFVVFVLPPACLLAALTLALDAADEGIGQPLAWLGVLVAGCAINCYIWHRKGWPGNMRST